MAVYGIIPARLESTRLPRKMLLDATGKSLIQHTYENVKQAKSIDTVLVATDSEEIAAAVREFGGTAVITPPCWTGSDRCYAALEVSKKLRDADLIVNVQGDWPDIAPEDIDLLVFGLETRCGGWNPDITTLVGLLELSEKNDPSKVKVAAADTGRALYFSRSSIPYRGHRGGRLLHYGAYGFRRAALREYARSPQTGLELDENLEQLRALEIGLSIRVLPAENKASGIDTQADYDAFVERMKTK